MTSWANRFFLSAMFVLGGLSLLPASVQAKTLSTPYFGTSYSGGANGHGFVFEVTKLRGFGGSDMKVIYDFCAQANCVDGGNPVGNVVQMPDGSLVGTTGYGGSKHFGTIFKLTPSMLNPGGWDETTLYTFCSYWEDCGHFGTPSGTLTLIGPTLLLGTLSDPKGKGVLYTYDVSASAWSAYDWWHKPH